MATLWSRRDCSLHDMLTKPVGAIAGWGHTDAIPKHTPEEDEKEAPVVCSFLKALFSSQRGDIHAIKKELSSGFREVCHEMDAIGEMLAHLEDQSMSHDEETERLQQEVVRFQDQQMDLQAHTQDLENRSRQGVTQLSVRQRVQCVLTPFEKWLVPKTSDKCLVLELCILLRHSILYSKSVGQPRWETEFGRELTQQE
ncbi:hypothetical protein NDU88_005723 [Pleurodeles waltl]|uniref:Uncharacterized protein n=1 Tax=Pleurodeles waltl TaxID=8319 RepID=A0AAV7TBG7_PLEWA|nr:hypothetical protein NDU88_005723 [Pleurodeles waltl]